MKTKNFAWIRTLKEEHSQRSSSSRTEEAQWLSKIQVPDEEKLKVTLPEHQELLEAFLACLPSRLHKVKAWADTGMMEYNYTKAKETKGDTLEHLTQDKEMKMDDKAHEELGNNLFKVAEPGPINFSMCDQVKEETEIAEDKALLEYTESCGKLKKVKRSMDDLTMDFLAQRAKLEGVSNQKHYLKPSLEETCSQYTHYTKGKEQVAELMATLSNDFSAAALDKLKKALPFAEAHYEGFKDVTLKEISDVLK